MLFKILGEIALIQRKSAKSESPKIKFRSLFALLRLTVFALNSLSNFRGLSFIILLLPILTLSGGPYYETPWGKDATLVYRKECSLPPQETSIAVKLIEFHQEVISPADGPRSHFMPSSSQYTKEAIIRFGFFKGTVMGCDRLMRENSDPWVYKTGVSPEGYLMKIDPVRP